MRLSDDGRTNRFATDRELSNSSHRGWVNLIKLTGQTLF